MSGLPWRAQEEQSISRQSLMGLMTTGGGAVGADMRTCVSSAFTSLRVAVGLSSADRIGELLAGHDDPKHERAHLDEVAVADLHFPTA